MNLKKAYSQFGQPSIQAGISALVALDHALASAPDRANEWAHAFRFISERICEEVESFSSLVQEAQAEQKSAAPLDHGGEAGCPLPWQPGPAAVTLAAAAISRN